MLYKVRELTVFESKVFHFAMWKWCSIHIKEKREWPGWLLFDRNASFNCFLCKDHLSVLCNNMCGTKCLNGLYMKSVDSFERLKIQPDNVSYQINFRNICMKIATVPFNVKFSNSSKNLQTIEAIKNDLKKVYKK